MAKYSENLSISTDTTENQVFYHNSDFNSLEGENEISFEKSMNLIFDDFNGESYLEDNMNELKDLIQKHFPFLPSKEFPTFNTPQEEKEVKTLYSKENKDNKENLNGKKRGREKKNYVKNKIHDKFTPDNVLRKIQVHYLSFIISFLNNILKYLNYKQQFLKLDYGFKKNVNNKFVESLKSKSIREIICNKISGKYRIHDENANKSICEILEKDEILNKILSENYLALFQKIYYKSNTKINLKEYGLNKDIIISKEVKMFKDLLKGNEAFDENNEYQEYINECAMQNYMPNSIFSTY